MEDLILYETPVVEIAGNFFVNVPIILQVVGTPLIETVKSRPAGYETQIRIYHSDGTYLAKVVGARLFSTPDGDKAGVTLKQPPGVTVCELAGKPIVELRRTSAAALKLDAELYSPKGCFVRCADSGLQGFVLDKDNKQLTIAGLTMVQCRIGPCQVGIWVKGDGHVAIASSGRSTV